MPISKDSFTIRVRQGIPLPFESDKGFLYYSGPTKDSVLFLSQRIPLPLPKGFLYYSGLTKDPELDSPPEGFLYYSGPRKNSFTIRVRQRIPVLFVSDKRAHPSGERELRADSSFSLARVGTTSIDRDLGSRTDRKERLEAEPLVEPQSK